MKPLTQLQKDFRAMPDGKTGGSYYSPLEIFLKAHLPDIATTSQETAPGKIGIPDITVRYEKSGKKIGWIEVKTLDEKLRVVNYFSTPKIGDLYTYCPNLLKSPFLWYKQILLNFIPWNLKKIFT